MESPIAIRVIQEQSEFSLPERANRIETRTGRYRTRDRRERCLRRRQARRAGCWTGCSMQITPLVERLSGYREVRGAY